MRLEADRDRFAPGDRTFYQSWVGNTAADAREPLPTVWSARYLHIDSAPEPPPHSPQIIIWRDPGEPGERFACSAIDRHPWYPLPLRDLVLFDEEENVSVEERFCTIFFQPRFDPGLVPAQANRVPRFFSPFGFGWLIVDLNPLAGEPFRQGWVGLVTSDHAHFSIGLAASPLDPPCAPSTEAIPEIP